MAQTIKVLHYNIKELDSTKLKVSNSQIKSVKSIISQYDFDFLSINELQYDFPGIPTESYQSQGKNLEKLAKLVGLSNFETIFGPANTGMNAKKAPDGNYYRIPNTPAARDSADQLNFGTMPGQYSTGGVLKTGKILKRIILNKIKWKDFNPSADFTKFKTAQGKSIPEDMLLFDKNFNHLTIKIKDKITHILLLHTVPSYHFGNEYSINDFRNAEQLRFLEWYMTGKTDYEVKLESVKPIYNEKYIIAMGDFNVAPNNIHASGTQIINRLMNKTNPWIKKTDMNFTNESSGFYQQPSRLMLDYIFASKNLVPLKGEIIHPNFEWIQAECSGDEPIKNPDQNIYKKVQYKKSDIICHAFIRHEYLNFKMASDHYPIYGEFEYK